MIPGLEDLSAPRNRPHRFSSLSAETLFRDENVTKTKANNDEKRLGTCENDKHDVENDKTTFDENDENTLWLVPAESD